MEKSLIEKKSIFNKTSQLKQSTEEIKPRLLSSESAKIVLDALGNPPKLNNKMLKALKDHDDRVIYID